MDLKVLEEIARQEMRANGLHGWTFALSNAKRRLGVCKYKEKRIEIAEYYARHSPEESVLDTLRHEIAHALAGPAAKHGPRWKAVAARLGATPRACETSGQAVVQPGDWRATCPACRKTVHLYRRPMASGVYRCRCNAARSPLTFEYTGDPARKPEVPITAQESANWEATCAGCGAVHLRVRRAEGRALALQMRSPLRTHLAASRSMRSTPDKCPRPASPRPGCSGPMSDAPPSRSPGRTG